MPAETIFRSDSKFSQRTFRRWVESRPTSDVNRYELIAGRIVMTPAAGWWHGSIEGRLLRLLGQHVTRHRLGTVFGSSTGYVLPSGDVLEPDGSFVSSERFAACPPSRPEEFLRAIPSIVAEIYSRATGTRDRTEKKALYGAAGIDEYWIVDGRHRSVTVFSLEQGTYGRERTSIAGNVRSLVLPKLRLPVVKLFAD